MGNRFDAKSLETIFRSRFGDLRLGAEELRTGLGLVAKRLDTGSIWPIVNIPTSRYYESRIHPDGSSLPGNRDIPIWQALRAATAAPTYFQAELIEEVAAGRAAEFIDGAISAHNNPALLALLIVATDGFGLTWPLSEQELLLCSVGTGRVRMQAGHRSADKFTILDWAPVLVPNLIGDSMELVETLLQWVSNSPTERRIDRTVGQIHPKLMDGRLLHYLRYNLELDRSSMEALGLELTDSDLQKLQDMSSIESIDHYLRLGSGCAGQVQAVHFPRQFDLSGQSR
jgi:hypothetical protein